MTQDQNIPVGYKQTDAGVIPEDWEVNSLGKVAKVTMGQSPKSTFYNQSGNGLPLIQGNADIKNRKTIIRSFTSNITKKGYKGEIVMTVRAPVGEIGRIEFDCCLGRGVCGIHYKNNYLYHYLIHLENYWDKLSKGSTFDSVNSKEVKELEIILPESNDEQKIIAQALSDIDSLISKLDQLIQKKKNIKQGAMQELLTGKRRLPGFSGEWVERKLDQIADFYKGSGLSKSKIVNDGQYPCILYGELFTTYSEVINLVISHTNAIEGLASKKGDVILPGSTTTSGIDLATASSLEVEDVLLGGDMIVLRKKTNEAFNSQFLAYYLTHISKYKIAEISQGITIIHLHGSRLKNILMFVPSDIKEQDAISKIIIEMSSEILLLESQRKKYQDLKQGMMQQLLTGKIRLI